MRIILVLAVVLLFVGCVTTPSFAPDKTIENTDGTVTFQFLFAEDGYNGDEAIFRIKEFLVSYMAENNFTKYIVLYAKATKIPKHYIQCIVNVRFRRQA